MEPFKMYQTNQLNIEGLAMVENNELEILFKFLEKCAGNGYSLYEAMEEANIKGYLTLSGLNSWNMDKIFVELASLFGDEETENFVRESRFDFSKNL